MIYVKYRLNAQPQACPNEAWSQTRKHPRNGKYFGQFPKVQNKSLVHCTQPNSFPGVNNSTYDGESHDHQKLNFGVNSDWVLSLFDFDSDIGSGSYFRTLLFSMSHRYVSQMSMHITFSLTPCSSAPPENSATMCWRLTPQPPLAREFLGTRRPSSVLLVWWVF